MTKLIDAFQNFAKAHTNEGDKDKICWSGHYEGVWASRDTATQILNFGSSWRCRSVARLSRCISQNEPWYPFSERSDVPQNRTVRFGVENNLLPLPGSRTTFEDNTELDLRGVGWEDV